VEHTNNEKNILAAVEFPFIVNLLSYWKDNFNLFMGLEVSAGGERCPSLSCLSQHRGE
jgi:hypothetical protein